MERLSKGIENRVEVPVHLSKSYEFGVVQSTNGTARPDLERSRQ